LQAMRERSRGRQPLPGPFPFLDHPWPIAFAHRGGAAGGLENSMVAFAHAVDLGYRYLETDVHATADGVLLAFHDRTLDRVTDRVGVVSRLPWALVSQARIGGREPIPTLEELLGAWPEVRVNIDVKGVGAIAPLVRAVRRTGALDRVCVASFSARRLSAVRRALGPQLCTALTPAGAGLLRVAAAHRLAQGLVPRQVPCAQVPDRVGRLPIVTAGVVELAHRHGLRVHVWTVDAAEEIERLLDLGVDGIMTDQVLTLRTALLRRGMWQM
ncbi:MAG: glycerophosphoryl diester phosphodiesterase, partial [Actinomycetota bacterium]|nr:glycerophosphoryl diester phosphodiesterase [Actinomycetota bacterium]